MFKNYSLFKKITFIILMLFYLGLGIAVIVLSTNGVERTARFCGLLILLSSLVHIFLYILQEGYKNKEKGFFLVIGLVGIALGIVFMCSDKYSVLDICLYWGILDIVKGALEIKDVVPEIKENKIEIVEAVISLGDIVLGILLCINLDGGITAHLIYLGVALILTAVKYTVHELVMIKKQSKN